MTFFIVLMAGFVGPLLVFALSAWMVDKFWVRNSNSSESKADYNRRLDELKRRNPAAFDPRSVSQEALRQRRASGFWLMTLPVIVYIGFCIIFSAVRP